MARVKKLLSVLLCLALVLSFFPVAFAEGDENEGPAQTEEEQTDAGIIEPAAEDEDPGTIATASAETEGQDAPTPADLERISYTAADPQAELTWSYYLDDEGGAVLNSFEGSLPANLTIPESVEGYPVTGIGWNLFEDHYELKSVQLPSGLKAIKGYAFAKTGLTALELPTGLLELGYGILFDNEGVKSITIPKTVTQTWSDGTSISPGPYEDAIWTGYGPLGGSAVETLTLESGATGVAHHLAAGAMQLKTVILPDSVTTIDYNAFENCLRLTSVTLPASLTEIHGEAFLGCEALTSLELPAGLKKIQNRAFAYTGLTALELPTGLLELGYGILFGNEGVKEITIPKTVTEMSTDTAYIRPDPDLDEIWSTYGPIGGSAIETLTLEDGASAVAYHLAAGALQLKTVNLPETVTYIHSWAFENCLKLNSIKLPASLTDLEQSVFLGCSNLTEIWFTGSAPNFVDNSFDEITSTAYYPGEDSSWTSDVMQDYEGHITWVATYDVTYDANGGTGAPEKQAKIHDEDLTLSTVKPTRDDESAGSYTVTLDPKGGTVDSTSLSAARTAKYTFKNWNTKADGSGTSYASGASYTANAAVTLYAQWNSTTTTAAVTLPTPTREGYSFQGWATSATATSGVTGSYTPTGNVTLYAIWKANTYTVSYDANGGTGAPAAQTKTHDVALTLSSTKPTRANGSAGSYTVTLDPKGGTVGSNSLSAARTTKYTFKNWNTKADGSGTGYTSGASYTVNAAVTLYAQWNSTTTTAAVTLPTPTREGYSFQGWATSATATSGVTGSYTPTGNVTLYAIWEKEADGVLSLSDVTGRPGAEILVPVSLSANPGVVMITFRVTYDSTVLSFLGVEDGTLTGWTSSTKTGKILWENSALSDQSATVELLKLRFQIKEEAADGSTVIALADLEALNANEDPILFGLQSGTVTISTRIAGDVNDDGEVNIKDVIRLRKYILDDSTPINASNADVTGDGRVSLQDLLRLRRYLVGAPGAVLN